MNDCDSCRFGDSVPGLISSRFTFTPSWNNSTATVVVNHGGSRRGTDHLEGNRGKSMTARNFIENGTSHGTSPNPNAPPNGGITEGFRPAGSVVRVGCGTGHYIAGIPGTRATTI